MANTNQGQSIPLRRRSKHLWHLVTNHQNMLYMLAAGMVMGPAGFRGKHYRDSLDTYPGWVPLFRNNVAIPAEVLTRATSERTHLLPCIASLNLANLSGPVRMLKRDGRERGLTSPAARKRKDDVAMLLPAPLPLTLLSSISFRCSADLHAFENAAEAVANVDLSPHLIEVSESLFSTTTDVTWPPAKLQEQLAFDATKDVPPVLGQTVGGVLAMLYYTANRSELGLAAFRLVTGTARATDIDLVRSDVILAELPGWLRGEKVLDHANIRAKLFWGTVHEMVDAQTQERRQPLVDVALSYLENQLGHLPSDETRKRLKRLLADMNSCYGLGQGTIAELFERHEEPFSKSLLLFCLREHCMDLLEFSHPLLSDVEYILAGILFGVRDGWLQMPRGLRDPNLSAYVTYRMADAERRQKGDSLSLEAPAHPRPLRDYLAAPDGESHGIQRHAALELARRCNWNECIRTRITLAEGDSATSIERNGHQVVLTGRIRDIAEEVDVAAVLRTLENRPWVSPAIEVGIRKKLKTLMIMEDSGGEKKEGVNHADDSQPATVHPEQGRASCV